MTAGCKYEATATRVNMQRKKKKKKGRQNPSRDEGNQKIEEADLDQPIKVLTTARQHTGSASAKCQRMLANLAGPGTSVGRGADEMIACHLPVVLCVREFDEARNLGLLLWRL